VLRLNCLPSCEDETVYECISTTADKDVLGFYLYMLCDINVSNELVAKGRMGHLIAASLKHMAIRPAELPE